MPPVGNAMSLAALEYVHNDTAMPAISDLYVGLLSLNTSTWAASTAYSLNQIIYVIVSGINYVMKCTTAGTSGTSAPAWDIASGSTTTDGTVTWTNEGATAGGWTASNAYGLGAIIYVVVNSVTYIMKCTTAGTSGSAAPSWNVAEGGTTTDNTVVWTEQTIAIRGGTFVEASGGGYARQAIANTTANFGVTTDANNRAQVKNLNLVNFGTVTASLGWIVGSIYFIASTGTAVWEWIMFTTPVNVTANSTPQIPANGDSLAIG